MKPLTEAQKQKHKENAKKYYKKHRQEICAKNRARYADKKALKNKIKEWEKKGWVTIQPKKEVFMQTPKIQDVYIHNFYSIQLERIYNALWWLCFVICFVGVVVLFK